MNTRINFVKNNSDDVIARNSFFLETFLLRYKKNQIKSELLDGNRGEREREREIDIFLVPSAT